ncbi:MAG: NAD(P)-binding domain-containing protein, partial [Solirubrobacteraceae bacterium]
MDIGLIGCGNMARAMARGWGRPVLCFDPISERAESLASETGGEAFASGPEVAQRAELIVLCHKPAQLEGVARELAPHARVVASILAATPLTALKNAYPGKPVYRFLPSLPAEVRAGAIVQARDPLSESERERAGRSVELDERVQGLFAQLGTLVTLDEGLVDVAMGLMSCAPAYVALVAEAQVDAGTRRGIPPAQA